MPSTSSPIDVNVVLISSSEACVSRCSFNQFRVNLKRRVNRVDGKATKAKTERTEMAQNLKNKIGKYNQKGTELQEENARLNNELEMQKLNLQHINDYLTRELEAKEN